MYKPTRNRVLVKVIEEENKSGIILLGKDKEKTSNGLIVDVGTDPHLEVKIGDTVVMKAYAGSNVTVAGELHVMVEESEILLVL